MPLQNRVTPEGEIVATSARGLLMGNRGGCLHDANKALGRRRWTSRAWIACRLEFHGRHRRVMTPGRYTELFFLDEATALAAGHRPCFECRHADAVEFATLWAQARGRSRRATAEVMDRALHAERLLSDGGKAIFTADRHALPDGTIVRGQTGPVLLHGTRQLPWTPFGYEKPRASVADGPLEVLTPASIIDVLKAGYSPMLHDSAVRWL